MDGERWGEEAESMGLAMLVEEEGRKVEGKAEVWEKEVLVTREVVGLNSPGPGQEPQR